MLANLPVAVQYLKTVKPLEVVLENAIAAEKVLKFLQNALKFKSTVCLN